MCMVYMHKNRAILHIIRLVSLKKKRNIKGALLARQFRYAILIYVYDTA